MPKTKESTPTLEELTTEQRENESPEYIAAVDASLEEAAAEFDAGDGIPSAEFWKRLSDIAPK